MNETRHDHHENDVSLNKTNSTISFNTTVTDTMLHDTHTTSHADVFHTQNNFRLLFDTVEINDGAGLASACVVLFLVAFFQEGKIQRHFI